MNIIEYLQTMIPIEKAWPGMRLNRDAQIAYLSRMEMQIRAGIAAELEDLVRRGAPFATHGLPTDTTRLDCTRYIPPSLFGNIQQEFFRAAALCVVGKAKATPDDWHIQAEEMRRRAVAAVVADLESMMAPPPLSDEDRKAMLAYELEEERKRERNE